MEVTLCIQLRYMVLIVAKCIVNNFVEEVGEEALTVLIVAKCIVNID